MSTGFIYLTLCKNARDMSKFLLLRVLCKAGNLLDAGGFFCVLKKSSLLNLVTYGPDKFLAGISGHYLHVCTVHH